MQTKEVLLFLTDKWADWEAAYVLPEVNSVSHCTVKTIAVDKQPKVSIGGLRAEIDYTTADCQNFDNTAILILPGGFNWQEAPHDDIAAFVKRAVDSGIPIAAICGATIFLGRHGFLDNTKHTGDDLELFMKEPGYNGQDFYVSAQVVCDKGIITANETAAVEFARVIFGLLKIDTDEELDGWYNYFKNGAVEGQA